MFGLLHAAPSGNSPRIADPLAIRREEWASEQPSGKREYLQFLEDLVLDYITSSEFPNERGPVSAKCSRRTPKSTGHTSFYWLRSNATGQSARTSRSERGACSATPVVRTDSPVKILRYL